MKNGARHSCFCKLQLDNFGTETQAIALLFTSRLQVIDNSTCVADAFWRRSQANNSSEPSLSSRNGQ